MPWFKIYIKNKGTWLSFVVLIICYSTASIDLWENSFYLELAEQPSAFIYSLEAILFGGVILVFPFCACLPIIFYCKKYSKEKCSCSIVFTLGGTSVAVPFIIHTLLWNIIAIPINTLVYKSHELHFYGLLNDIYNVLYGIPVYTIFAAGMFLSGGTFALIYYLSLFWCDDDIVAFLFPALIYFGWLKLSTHITWLLPAPVHLFDEGLTIRNAFVLVAIYFYLIYICVKLIKSRKLKGDKNETRLS